ncbi:LptF/LptG family permease [Jiella marina]|uniref:LptF/LptG family permease n=1 Tax=Jiella sp. LLJ827 TaxID=2917712 RepID=UPI00210105DF|nr:LptF/LptG family permease [Jiella sp. LLJ827]MCQ0988427.1 LptF/LptG family permease [Jiella sp. LLJ827]
MTLLERYVFRRALSYSLGTLASLVLIVWIVQALSRIDIVKSTASAAGNVFWIALMLLPDLAAGVVPFAILIGAVQALNGLNADSERAVMAASGASPGLVARPIVILGLLGGIFVLLVAHVVGPMSARGFQNGIRAINADTITLFLQPGRFERVQDGLQLSIGEARGSSIESLFIADTRDPKAELIYFAREARISEENGRSLLLLGDGQLHRRNLSDNAVSVIEFQSYAFDLADLRPASGGDWTRSSERSTSELISPDPADSLYRDDPSSFTEELTERMTNWLYVIAFALWAVVVAAHPRTNREASSAAMTLGLIGGLGLKAAGFVAISQIESSAIWVFISFLLPLSAIVLDSYLIWSNADITHWAVYRWFVDGIEDVTVRVKRLFVPRRAAAGGAGQ